MASSPSSPNEDHDLLVYQVVSTPLPVQVPERPPIHYVYQKRKKESNVAVPDGDPPISASSSDLEPHDEENFVPPIEPEHDISPTSDDLPIALRKGKRSCTYPISSYVSYNQLSPASRSFIASLDSITIPTTLHQALSHSGWRAAMEEEMMALEQSGTWTLVDLPKGKKAIGCKWVFTIKTTADGSLERLKARLVAKGYAQTYGVDYSETFSPVAKLSSVRLFISMAATYDWALHQLDVKNAFLNGTLNEEVYMEQPPGFVAQGENGKVCLLRNSLYGLKQSPRAWFNRFCSVVRKFGLIQSKCDHSVFYQNSDAGLILLVVYVDDIVITGSNVDGISSLKVFLNSQFQTKDLGPLKYFLGIEVMRSKKGIFLT